MIIIVPDTHSQTDCIDVSVYQPRINFIIGLHWIFLNFFMRAPDPRKQFWRLNTKNISLGILAK